MSTLPGPAQPGRACRRRGATGCGAGLAEGRRAVALIVGRDPERLDAAGVGAGRGGIAGREPVGRGGGARCSGAPSPACPGMLAYKAVNTLDSMVGHRSERYRAFGWASARFDDLAQPRARPASPALLLCLAGGAAAARSRRCAPCGATRRGTARPTPAGPRRRWRPPSACASPARASMAARRSTTAGWATAAPRSTPADIDRALRPRLARLVAAGGRLALAARCVALAWPASAPAPAAGRGRGSARDAAASPSSAASTRAS